MKKIFRIFYYVNDPRWLLSPWIINSAHVSNRLNEFRWDRKDAKDNCELMKREINGIGEIRNEFWTILKWSRCDKLYIQWWNENEEKISSNNEQFSKIESLAQVDRYVTYYFSRHEPRSLEFVSKKKKKSKKDIIRSNLKQMDNEFPYFLASGEFARENKIYLSVQRIFAIHAPPSPNLGKLTCTRRIVTAICIPHARRSYASGASQRISLRYH